MAITVMTSYVVYDNPTDYPGKFVVRKFSNEVPDQNPTIVCDTLEQARKSIPDGLFKMPPEPGDDPVIKEVWI